MFIYEDTPESSDVARIGYDVGWQILSVEFFKGGEYWYFGVPADVALSFSQAPSKGRFLAHQIKGHYRYEKAS
jgi:hypothetical protein